jgi:hypothetical protein
VFRPRGVCVIPTPDLVPYDRYFAPITLQISMFIWLSCAFYMKSLFNSIQGHFRKQGLDYIVVDVTGASKQQIRDVTAYINGLSMEQQAKIIQIGF